MFTSSESNNHIFVFLSYVCKRSAQKQKKRSVSGSLCPSYCHLVSEYCHPYRNSVVASLRSSPRALSSIPALVYSLLPAAVVFCPAKIARNTPGGKSAVFRAVFAEGAQDRILLLVFRVASFCCRPALPAPVGCCPAKIARNAPG